VRRKLAVLVAAMLAPAYVAAPAHATPTLADEQLGPVTALAGGLFEVRLRTGEPLTTHGPDAPPRVAGEPRYAPERAPVCAGSHHVRVLYGHAAGTPDRRPAVLEQLRSVMRRMNARLDAAARESGGVHADLRVRCDAAYEIAVDGFVNAGSASFADVVDAARLAGATSPQADYLIFYDDATPDACGTASFAADDRLDAGNENNRGGGYAVVYSDCWTAVTAMHEVGHTQGAVQPGAPNSTGSGGHCRDEWDVMCYDDGAGGIEERCGSPEAFDCGYDDYFDAAPEPGEYLASHWNLGSPLNRFVWFSDLASGDDDTEEPPAPRLRPVRIVRGTVSAAKAEVTLACPSSREVSCAGRVALRDRRGRTVGRRSFTLAIGEQATVPVRIARRARSRGVRALRAVVREEGLAVTARRLARGRRGRP